MIIADGKLTILDGVNSHTMTASGATLTIPSIKCTTLEGGTIASASVTSLTAVSGTVTSITAGSVAVNGLLSVDATATFSGAVTASSITVNTMNISGALSASSANITNLSGTTATYQNANFANCTTETLNVNTIQGGTIKISGQYPPISYLIDGERRSFEPALTFRNRSRTGTFVIFAISATEQYYSSWRDAFEHRMALPNTTTDYWVVDQTVNYWIWKYKLPTAPDIGRIYFGWYENGFDGSSAPIMFSSYLWSQLIETGDITGVLEATTTSSTSNAIDARALPSLILNNIYIVGQNNSADAAEGLRAWWGDLGGSYAYIEDGFNAVSYENDERFHYSVSGATPTCPLSGVYIK